jgi:dTDP-4-amino-4,6-dideoxygalactose transaminase
LQEAYVDLNKGPGAYPLSEKMATEILSLPIFPELESDEVTQVVASVNSFK